MDGQLALNPNGFGFNLWHLREKLKNGYRPADVDTAAGILEVVIEQTLDAQTRAEMHGFVKTEALVGRQPPARGDGEDADQPERSYYESAAPEGVLDGVGPDAEVGVNERGGKQSVLPGRCDLLPPRAVLDVSRVLKHGAQKYGEDNWHAISVREHLDHVLHHAFAHLAGDGRDDHLAHLACRALMALEIYHREQEGRAA